MCVCRCQLSGITCICRERNTNVRNCLAQNCEIETVEQISRDKFAIILPMNISRCTILCTVLQYCPAQCMYHVQCLCSSVYVGHAVVHIHMPVVQHHVQHTHTRVFRGGQGGYLPTSPPPPPPPPLRCRKFQYAPLAFFSRKIPTHYVNIVNTKYG